MALSRDASSPAVFSLLGNGTNTPSPASCAAFTPPLGAKLLAFVALNRQLGTTPTITVTTTAGSTSSWVQKARIDDASGGIVAIYEATVLASAATTVQVSSTATTTGTYPAEPQAYVWIDVWTGHAGTGVTVTGTSTSQTINPTLTTTSPDSQVAGIANDWNVRGVPTSSDVGSGIGSSPGSWLSAIRAYKAAVTPVPGTSVALNIAAPASGPEWAYALVEILESWSTGKAPVNLFDVTQTAAGWFDPDLQQAAWFDADFATALLVGEPAWNPTDASAGTVLTENNLRFSNPSADGGVRGTASHTGLDAYLEFTLLAGDAFIGLAPATKTLTAGYADAFDAGWFAPVAGGGNVWANNTWAAFTVKSLALGETGRLAVSGSAGKFWIGNAAGWDGDPFAKTGGYSLGSLAGQALFPFISNKLISTTTEALLNLGATSFTYPVPSGYLAWNTVESVAQLTATEAADTVAVAAAIVGSATLAATEAGDTAAISASVTAAGISGTLAATEAADTPAVTAAIVGTAALAATEAADTVAVAAAIVASATLAVTEPADTAAVAASAVTAASLAATEAADTAAVSAAIVGTASLSVTEAADTAAISAAIVASATLAATEQADTVSVLIGNVASATLAAIEAPDTAAASAAIVGTASLTATEAADTAAVSAAIVGTASLSVTEAADTAALAAAIVATASLAATEARDTASVAVSAVTSASLTATETADTVAIAAALVSSATLAATEAADSAAITAAIVASATLAATEANDNAAIAGTVTSGVFGQLAATEAADSFAATGNVVPFIRPTHTRPGGQADQNRSAQLATGIRNNTAAGTRPAAASGGRRAAQVSSRRR